MTEKLKDVFDEMVVYKDLKNTNFFSAISLPSFLRDWVLKKFEDDDGNFDIGEVQDFLNEYLPKKDNWESIKDRIAMENERVKILAKISVNINIKTQTVSFALPDYSISYNDTIIESNVWETVKENLLSGKETWGVVELGYRIPEDNKTPGKIKLTSFKDFCPYTIDLNYYKESRNEFTIEEWIDVILGAVDYNASGYEDEGSKLYMLTRLLPFVEKRLNLIELAPKGTGKSYLFGRVSKFGWLSTGGVMSRAKMFYDQTRRTEGLVCNNDFIALDEAQTITFPDVDEMRAALKGYMESGTFTVGNHEGKSDAGIILLGNIKKDNWEIYNNMFEELPKEFHESALIDRFHGFIEGWKLPRMHDDLKISDWALNSEYFCTIMHMLRDDVSYRSIVDELIIVPEKADTRDTEAVKRIATAYLKLLFPNVTKSTDITKADFKKYCLDPAYRMRDIIKIQLGKLDEEFKGKSIPTFTVAEL